MIVEAPRRRRRPLRDPLFQSGSDNDVARDHRFTVGGANRKAIDNAVGVLDALDPVDGCTELHVRVDSSSCPAQVVVEFVARGEEGLVVDEVDQSTLLEQIREEAVSALWIPERHQVLRKRDLHGGTVEQHPGMPRELRLLFEEPRVHPINGRTICIVFFDSNGQREVGRTEPDADDVDNGRFGAGVSW